MPVYIGMVDGINYTANDIRELKADAERYRWLKANQLNELMWVHMEYEAKAYSYEELDAAIDAAREGEK